MAELPQTEAELAQLLELSPAAVAIARGVFNVVARSPLADLHRVALLRSFIGPEAGLSEIVLQTLLGYGAVEDLATLGGLDGMDVELLSTLTYSLATVPLQSVRLSPEDATPSQSAQLIHHEQVQISELATSVGTQLRRADSALRGADSSIRMGPVTLQLKGALTSDANQLAMRFASGIERSDQLSEVTLQFTPRPTTKTTTKPGTAPDVVGYTEALARRKAVAAGYHVDVRRELLAPGDEDRRGRVVRQRPAAGEALGEGGKIELYLGVV